MKDLIERQDAIDALEKSRFPGAPYIDTGVQIAMREIKELPSAQPTIYGYKIEHLMYIARVMEKEGVSAEYAVRTFDDMSRVIKMIIDEIKVIRELNSEDIFPLKVRDVLSNRGRGNIGKYNVGDHNIGTMNCGNCNTGNNNIGTRNTGYGNRGHYNSGEWNEGYRNSGVFNSGDYNTGSWNKTSYSAGFFNTEPQLMIMMFNKYVKLTLGEVDIIRRHLQAMSERIRMKTLSGEDIDWIRRLPGFDAKIFKEITGIDLDSEWARHLESLAAQLSRQPLTVF